MKRVEQIPRQGGVLSYREIGDDGEILYVVDEAIPLKRLVTRIADEKLPFGGKWTQTSPPFSVSDASVGAGKLGEIARKRLGSRSLPSRMRSS